MAALLAASSSIACKSIRCAAIPGTANSVRVTPPSHVPSPSAPIAHRLLSIDIGASAMAAAFFASIASADSAVAAQEVMSLAADDNRGLALLLPLIPAIGWVLFNILQPALKQLDRMKSTKGLALGLGIGAATSLLVPWQADAAAQQEILSLAAGDNDSRGSLVLLVLLPAIGWVLFNILKPGLSQLEKMKSVKGIVGAAGLSAAALLMAASQASTAGAAVVEAGAIAEAAGSDNRGLLLFAALVPALGWVLFNILQPALNQLDRMKISKGLVGAAGLSAAAGALFLPPRSDAAQEISSIADAAASSDSRGILLLGVLIPAVGWVLFNILQPGLIQLDKMRAQK